MAQTFHKTTRLDLPPDGTVELMTDEDFLIAKEKAQDALDVQYREISRTEKALEYELVIKQYARGIRGIDRSKTQTSRTVFKWDLVARRCRWDYIDPDHADRVDVHGTSEVFAEGEGSRIEDEFSANVSIPLLGKKIAKLIISEVQKGWDKYDRVLRQYAKDRG